jgi:hypothetical protein
MQFPEIIENSTALLLSFDLKQLALENVEFRCVHIEINKSERGYREGIH